MLKSNVRKKLMISIVSTVLILVFMVGQAGADQSGRQIATQANGETAYEVVSHFSEDLGVRSAGGPREIEARDYIAEQLKQYGYEVEIQPFTFTRSGVSYNSANVIATKKGSLDQTVIIGAHYDSVTPKPVGDQVGTGAGDNATGVGVLLETAKVLADYKTQGTIKFVAFGAEERGLKGSSYYVSQMSQQDVDNTVTMINLDCVGVGDYFYVYSALEENPGWARDLALNIGQGMGLDLRTSPQSEYFDYGTTGDWSDHVPFRQKGIPIAYFEWMNWDIEPDGGLETAEYGMIMHTGRDNLSFVSKDKLQQTTKVVAALAFELSKTKLPKSERGTVAQGNKYIVQKRHGLQE